MKNFLALALLFVPVFSAAAQTSPRPAITGIAFLRVYTDDVPAAQKFYGQTLGYQEHRVDGMLIFPINTLQWVEVIPEAPPTPGCMFAAVGVTTRDAAGMERYLSAHGVAIEQPLHDGEFAVRDPEGNLVVFVQSAAAKDAAAAGSVARLVAAAPLSSTAASHRMIHVGFIVHDRAKEDAFWHDLLGFRPYWHGTMHPPHEDFVSAQVPDGTDWIEYMMMPGQQPSKRDFGMSDHFSLGVDHMQSVLADLQRNGCEGKSCTAIQAGVDGKVQLNLFDPDQTRVEYMEFQPVMKPCCSEFTGPHPSGQESR